MYSILTFPTGKDELKRLILTPSKEPAQTILYGVFDSQKYFNEVIKFSDT